MLTNFVHYIFQVPPFLGVSLPRKNEFLGARRMLQYDFNTTFRDYMNFKVEMVSFCNCDGAISENHNYLSRSVLQMLTEATSFLLCQQFLALYFFFAGACLISDYFSILTKILSYHLINT